LDWETELLNSFEAIVHRDFPNPHRIGCPGRDSLAGLAACRGDAATAQVLAHIQQCAPCFDELRELCTQTVKTQAIYNWSPHPATSMAQPGRAVLTSGVPCGSWSRNIER
jgi:hypothetical protein